MTDDKDTRMQQLVSFDREEADTILACIDATDGEELTQAQRDWLDDMIGTDGFTEDFDMGAYLEGILDYRTLRSADGDILEVHILTAFGGPNVWRIYDGNGNETVKAYWWGDYAEATHQHELFDRIFDYMREVVLCA